MSTILPSGPYPFLRPRRWLFAGLVFATTLLGTLMMFDIVRSGGVTAVEIVILVLFPPTFGWISVSFWNASLGFALRLLRRDPISLRPVDGPASSEAPLTTRTALIVPARNEDPGRLVAGLHAMLVSLEETGSAESFDLFLLSDTIDPAFVAPEEEAWLALKALAPRPERLHYRRRDTNEGHKAGNVADFCDRWGGAYDFMVVLDADSVMAGSALVELARAMEATPDAGIIQSVPIPARQETAFGRFLQFAGAVYSPMLATGQAFWQTDTANYWGHNAIVRLQPFRDHGRLPILPGKPPLGGPILSHDFVEAALLRRAGWRVYLCPSLGGSYEETPADIFAFAKRDRRWAQGSLQHLRLLPGRGWHPLSRVHFVFGAMGYVSSGLWLLLLLTSTLYVAAPGMPGLAAGAADGNGPLGVGLRSVASVVPLLAVTAVILFLPKVLGVLLTWLEDGEGFGGGGALVAGALLEALFAILVAPVMMMYHSAFLASILAGRNVDWSVQDRRGRDIGWRESLRRTSTITGMGTLWAFATLYISPSFFLWLTPIFTGLFLVGPIARWTASPVLGRWLKERGLLTVPSESRPAVELDVSYRRLSGVGPILQPEDTRDRNTMHQLERGLFELRRGRLLGVVPAGGTSAGMMLIAPVEGLDAEMLGRLKALGSGEVRLVVTPLRAGALGLLAEGDPQAPPAMSLGLNGQGPRELLALASSVGISGADLEFRPATEAERCALTMTRFSELLPAVVTVDSEPARVPALRRALHEGEILTVDAEAIQALRDDAPRDIEITSVSAARVPLEDAHDTRFILFREGNGFLEHVAILIGEPATWPDVVPVRLHSACLTGDLFGSLRCDCGEQLRGSLRYFTERGAGVLLYLQQEGRGIGLGNKLRAYALQEQGLDTVDADHVLGFGADERRYEAAVGMLRHLRLRHVELLTNNPLKIRALESAGIQVERVPLHGTLNHHNLRYVHAKMHRAGHWLSDMPSGATRGR